MQPPVPNCVLSSSEMIELIMNPYENNNVILEKFTGLHLLDNSRKV